jgi:hypothetical protein
MLCSAIPGSRFVPASAGPSIMQIARCQTGVLGDSSKNARTEFLVVIKGEDEVRLIGAR